MLSLGFYIRSAVRYCFLRERLQLFSVFHLSFPLMLLCLLLLLLSSFLFRPYYCETFHFSFVFAHNMKTVFPSISEQILLVLKTNS
jgi:hypothetical protein